MITFTTGTIIAACLVVGGLMATALVRAWAVRRNALVLPSERCSHQIPTPHGGGIAIAALTIILGAMFLALGWVPEHSMLAFIGLGLFMLVLGVWDDFGDVSAKFRLAMHFGVAGIGLASIPALPVVSFWGFELDPTSNLLFWPVLLVGWVWLINLYNFMDGIDGLAAVQALALFGGMAFNFWMAGSIEWSWICVFMVGAVSGFTILNWPPAKIFMGDGGSGFLGFVIGFMMLLSAAQTSVSMWSWAILLTLFITDATVTLLVRFFTGQNVLQAHRTHAYQLLTRRLGGHLPVTLGYGAVMVFVLTPLSWLASVFPNTGLALFGLAFLVSGAMAFMLGCGQPEAECNKG
ncbi:MAG: glycosyltransferase family 4 protein [Alteromonadaceae bacterium]|nr:glycosyltransferase family 4 protein [Alteromonadaceae bacterium]